MADELYVLNEGTTIPTDFTATVSAGTYNIKTSVNPIAISKSSTASTTLGINCYEVHSDDTSSMGSGTVSSSKLNRLFPVSTTVADYADNIIENHGYRVTIDTGNASGLTLAGTKDYFVVIYADNVKKHHVAKIEEQTQYDGNNYHFEFTPRLKENITVGTKVAIYQGPDKTDNIVAVGYGLLNDEATSEERHDKYVEISRPTFYFYSDDKLDHDRKYTLLKTSTNFSGTKKSVFKTAPISSDMIIDKGFFTHHGDLTDNNRENDNLSTPRGINTYNALGSTYTFDETTWAGSSKNIYDSDGGLSTYITFIDSPTKNQIHSNPYYVNVNKTVTNKGNLAEIKFFDTEKILDKKINSYEQFRVKQLIAEKNLDSTANNPLPGTCSKTTSNTFTVSGLVGGEDWRKVMFDGSSAYEPVFIGTYYYTITGITAPSAGSQVVTIGDKRLITSNVFAGSAVLEAMSSAIAYRKTWSPVSQTYIAGHQIDIQISYADAITRNGNTVTSADSDVNGIEYLLENADNEVFLEVEKGDKDTGYTKLTSRPASNFFASKYLNDSISGKLLINNPIFDGFVESRKADVKQAFKYEIVGRDSINKLLNTNLDKNYVHSEEFVYTTFNPYVGDNTSSTELEYVSLIANSISGRVITTNLDPTTRLSYGDTIAFDMNDDRYVVLGVVESTSSSGSNTVTLMKDCYITDLTNIGNTTLNSNRIHRIRKSIIPSKNLETDARITNRATSLAGTLDKGIVFGSGREFSSTGDTNLLIQTKETNVENGYNIDDFLTPIVNSDGEYLDFPLGFKTTLNIPSSTPEMEIITGDNTEYELGYISPIVLGMVVRNNSDFYITTGNAELSQPVRLINGQGLPDGGFLHLLNNATNSDYTPKTFNNIFRDDPEYSSSVKSQYALRYNQPIFRYNNIHKSNYRLLQIYSNKGTRSNSLRFSDTSVETDQTYDLLYTRNDYYENTKNFNFYLSAFKTNKKNVDYNADTSTNYLKGIPNEQRGLLPVMGSKFFDITRYPHWYRSNHNFYGNRFAIDVYEPLQYYVGKMELHDPSALSMHLFSLGDVYPESKKNHNNIFTSQFTRDVSEYSLIFKRDKTPNNQTDNAGYTHFRDENAPNLIQVSSRVDSDYHVEPIVSITGDQKRFNLLRLTDVTMDILFNEVDYENLPLNNKGTELSKLSTKGFTSGGVNQSVLIKTFPQAGLHHVPVVITSVSSDDSQLNVTSTHWWNNTDTDASGNPDYEYYIYAFINGVDYPTFIGKPTGVVSATVLEFTNPLSTFTAVNVEDVELYVRTAPYGVIGNNAGNNKMLLTKDSVIPYHQEDTNINSHNYLSTSFFSNSNLESNNGTTGSTADDTFNAEVDISSSNDISAIVRTPMFKGRHGEGGSGGETKVVRSFNDGLDNGKRGANFHFKADVTCSGATITFPSGSKLTHFFDKVKSHSVMFSDGNMNEDRLFGDSGTTAAVNDISNQNTWQITSSGHDTGLLETGMKFHIKDAEYTIYKILSSSQFKASPVHNDPSGSGHSVDTRRSVITHTGAIVKITGFADSTLDRNYLVSSYTDTTLVLQNIVGGTAVLGTVSSAFTIEVKGAGPNYSSWDNTLKTEFISNDDKLVNGELESDASFDVLNSIIPHRAWHDSEGRIDYSDLQTVVLKFKDILDLSSEFKSLSQDVINAIGSICEDEFTKTTPGGSPTRASNMYEVAFRKGSAHNVFVQYWNRALFITYAQNRGLISENFRFGATQYGEKIYGADLLFKPLLSVTSSMILTNSHDNTLSSDERILKIDYDYTMKSVSESNSWINYCNDLTGYYFRNDGKIHKVISHEISRLETDVFRHFIKLDNGSTISNGDELFLMRTNQVCMYDFSPTKIFLNTAKPEYTKIPGQDAMQSIISDATRISASDDGDGMVLDTTNNTKGILSMYVLIDPDGTINNPYLETREIAMAKAYNQFSDTGTKVFVTDGVNKFTTTLTKKNAVLEFGEVKKVLGSTSIGSTFTVNVNKSPDFTPDTACIGSSFKIVDELERVIDDAFTINDITYTKDTEADTYFGAFNFTGQSLYSAANNLLSYKNKEILVDGEEIKIVDKEDSKKYRNIILSSKDSTYSITSINNDVSLFDNFDEVIVIGDGVRGIARNPLDTSNSNRTVKSKQIYDYSILDQKQADLKAVQYLDVFNSANTSIEIEVADNVPFLKPGQIIELEFSEQNIPRGDYLVIEIEKEFGSPTKFTLSEYNKDLAGTFATLMGEIRNLQGFTKQKVYTTTTIPRTKRDKVNIKFVKATGTLTSGVTTTSTIGFGYTIGFDSEVGV